MNFSEENQKLLELIINEFIKNCKNILPVKEENNLPVKEEDNLPVKQEDNYKKIQKYKKLRSEINEKRGEITNTQNNLIELRNGQLSKNRKLYYCYNNTYYKIENFGELGVDCLLRPDNNIDYQISRSINRKICDLMNQKLENIKKEINSLMKKVIEIEVDFINRKDNSLIEIIGLTEKICKEKIGGRCAYMIDHGFSGYIKRMDYVLSFQEVIEKNWGYNCWIEDDKERYYYEYKGPYIKSNNYNSLSLIEYYYMLHYFHIDFEIIHNVLNEIPNKKEYFINDDYEYLYLYKQIGGKYLFGNCI